MAQFAADTFNDIDGTNLPTHDANWVKHGSSGSSQLIITNANRIRVGTTDSSETIYYHSGSPASADYTVQADFLKKDDSNGAIFVCGRMSTTANTFYGWRYVRDSGASLAAWQLYKRVAGTFTQLGSSVSQTLTTDVAYEGKLRMSGSTIEGYKEGSGTPSVSTTDTAITVAGKAGLRATGYTSTNTSSLHLDNFSADDIVGSSATSTPPVRAFPRSILMH